MHVTANQEEKRIIEELGTRLNSIKKKDASRLTNFDTGAVRDNEKDIYALTLISPIALRRIGITCKEGEKGYGPYNWEKGMPVRDLLEHVMGHVNDFLSGETDPAVYEDHLAHAAWGLIGAMHSQVMWPHLNEGTLRLPGCIAPNTVVNEVQMNVQRRRR